MNINSPYGIGKMSRLSDKELLLREATKIADALAETFAPLCEVVVHDLTNPDHTIIRIGNNLSGRSVGDSATELGLARMGDPTFPDVIANYSNSFRDGRPAKSTSIGLRDKSGNFVAAICLNMDLSYLRSIGGYLEKLTEIKSEPITKENLSGRAHLGLYPKILEFAAARNRDPRSLTTQDKRELIAQLAEEGALNFRGAAEQIGAIIGISRSNVYYYLKEEKNG